MIRLSNSQMIDIWERGFAEDSIERALTILASCTGEEREYLALLGIGERDARLFKVHEQMFGASLDAFAECPVCHEQMEYQVCTHDLIQAPIAPVPITLSAGADVVKLRLPNSLDLRKIAHCKDKVQATKLLAQRCIEQPDSLCTSDELADGFIEAIATTIAAADPRMETLIDLTCRACGHQWEVVLAIERFLWSKISVAAKRLLREVHALATVYGWSESKILALSAARRQAYLEMACPTF